MTRSVEETCTAKPQSAEPAERIIGRYTGEEGGPLLVCLGGIHGNEPAGIRALEIVFNLLDVEPQINPHFSFRGRLLGLRGNMQAIARGERFIERDLNRLWTRENIEWVRRQPRESLQAEYRELHDLIDLIEREIKEYKPERFFLLDLHTTTAHGGIFSVVSDDPESVRIAVELHAPVIKGLLQGIRGTSLHYFNSENFDNHAVAIAFESGQHDDPLSINRAIAAITNCLRSIGCVRADDVENRHDELLIEYSKNLPRVAQLITTHSIHPGDNFRMAPNFDNFQPVKRGELLAYDKNGAIYAEADGRILMPLYQKQGDDGFFLIRPLDY